MAFWRGKSALHGCGGNANVLSCDTRQRKRRPVSERSREVANHLPVTLARLARPHLLLCLQPSREPFPGLEVVHRLARGPLKDLPSDLLGDLLSQRPRLREPFGVFNRKADFQRLFSVGLLRGFLELLAVGRRVAANPKRGPRAGTFCEARHSQNIRLCQRCSELSFIQIKKVRFSWVNLFGGSNPPPASTQAGIGVYGWLRFLEGQKSEHFRRFPSVDLKPLLLLSPPRSLGRDIR